MPRPFRFSVLWTRAAVGDLDEIISYIARTGSPGQALRVLRRLKTAAAALARFPSRGRVVPELREHGVEGYREVAPSPWRVLYRIAGARVWVLAVIDSRRNIEDILLRRLLR